MVHIGLHKSIISTLKRKGNEKGHLRCAWPRRLARPGGRIAVRGSGRWKCRIVLQDQLIRSGKGGEARRRLEGGYGDDSSGRRSIVMAQVILFGGAMREGFKMIARLSGKGHTRYRPQLGNCTSATLHADPHQVLSVQRMQCTAAM